MLFADPVHDTEDAAVAMGGNHQSVKKTQVAPAGIGRPNHQEEDSKETIPVKGTLISAGFVVLMIFISLISIGIQMEDQMRTLIIKIVSELFRAIRCPLIAFVTYKARKAKSVRIPD